MEGWPGSGREGGLFTSTSRAAVCTWLLGGVDQAVQRRSLSAREHWTSRNLVAQGDPDTIVVLLFLEQNLYVR